MSMFKPGDKVQLALHTVKLAKPELKEFEGQVLTIKSQPYVGRFTVEGSDVIFCDWWLEPVKEQNETKKAKTKKV